MENKEFSEAEVLNKIENRLRNKESVTDKEVRLLIEGYTAFGVIMPDDIIKILNI